MVEVSFVVVFPSCMTDPKFITLSLSRLVEENGDRAEIAIY
jgi:hypothetical protein